MDLALKGCNAIIAGASRGIGLAIAQALAEEGCNVALGAQEAAQLDEAAARLRAHEVEVVALAADFSGGDGCRAFVEGAVAGLGGCDILVNNGDGGIRGTLESLDAAQWRLTFDLELMSCVHTTRFAVPHLKKSRAGRVLNVAGISGTMLFPGTLATSLPHAAIIRFGKLMAAELAPFGILVNTLCPGNVEGEGEGAERPSGALAAMSMLNRLGRPREIGWLAAFLVSGRNSYMTGSTVECCGGATRYL